VIFGLSKENMINRSVQNIFFMAAAFFTGCCLFIACENDEKTIQDWSKEQVMVEEATMIESYLSQEGRLKAKLTAPLMIRVLSDTLQVKFPNSLHADFFNDSSVLETWVDSKHGIYYESMNKVYLWDSVVVINIQGDTLKASDLWWDQNTKLFYTEKYAEYRRKDRQIFPGKGLEATQDFSRVTFNYPTGFLQVKDDGFPQ
jgi:LPS export ABC transporter protein LptC